MIIRRRLVWLQIEQTTLRAAFIQVGATAPAGPPVATRVLRTQFLRPSQTESCTPFAGVPPRNAVMWKSSRAAACAGFGDAATGHLQKPGRDCRGLNRECLSEAIFGYSSACSVVCIDRTEAEKSSHAVCPAFAGSYVLRADQKPEHQAA